MAVTPSAPCGWAPAAPCSSGPCSGETSDPAVQAQAESLAAAIIWRLTGMRHGCCEITVRPCKPKTCDPIQLAKLIYWDSRAYLQFGAPNLGVLSFFPTLIDGQIYNIQCGCPTGCCKCEADCEVNLPGPICSISNVTVDGVVLDPSMYRVMDGNRLIFNHILVSDSHYTADLAIENALYTAQATIPDSAGTPVPFVPDLVTEAKFASFCPPCQDYNLPAGEIGTWTVTYSIGVPVPDELNFAAGLYACEIAKSLVGDKSCVLPARVQQVARAGVSTTFVDPLTLTMAGLTGIPLVDTIIKAINPNGLTSSSRVWFPGKTSTVRRDMP